MRTLLQALSALSPRGVEPQQRPLPVAAGSAEAAADAAWSADTASSPAAVLTPARPLRPSDPYYLTVVPYLPRQVAPLHRVRHPRIANPFGRFPNRAQHLYALMRRAAPAPGDGASAP